MASAPPGGSTTRRGNEGRSKVVSHSVDDLRHHSECFLFSSTAAFGEVQQVLLVLSQFWKMAMFATVFVDKQHGIFAAGISVPPPG